MNRYVNIFLTLTLMFVVDAARGGAIYNIQINPNTVAALQWNQNVEVTFNYKTFEAGGVRIYARPMSGNSLSSNYVASGSPLYTADSGTGTGTFSISSGNVTVNSVRFQMWDANETVMFLEFYIPVKFYFGSNAISNIQLSYPTYASLQHNQTVEITFAYKTTEDAGVRILPRPMSGDSLASNYVAAGSPLYEADSGTGSNYFTITTGDIDIDGIRFQLWDANQTTLLLEFVVPVKLKFSQHSISNIVVSPSTANGMLVNEDVTVSFDYRTTEASGVRIFARPFNDGALTPDYTASGSSLFPTGNGTGTSTFTIASGSVAVDSIRLEMWDANQTQLLLEWFVPVNLFFSSSKITEIAFEPTSPAYFTNNEPENITFNYTTNENGGVRIIARPMSGSSLTPDYSASASPLYTKNSGSGTGNFTIVNVFVVVDGIRFQMWNPNQTTMLLECFVPVKFYFGNQTNTGVKPEDNSVITKYMLSQNYPNPFNPTTVISYQLPVSSTVTLKIYDMLGREVKTLVYERQTAGLHSVTFDASNLSSAVYFYRFQAGSYGETKKLVLLK